MAAPAKPKIYHIAHVDRLPSIIADGYLWCDAKMARRNDDTGTTVGMSSIKQRRLNRPLTSHPGLHIGDCVPFYFCPRSVMLYVIHQANHPELGYCDGQESIIHLEADLRETVAWAEDHEQRWAFTLSNAGAFYFEDRCDLEQLEEVDWDAVQATNWSQCKEGKQAEFLIEQQFPWELASHIGVRSQQLCQQVEAALGAAKHLPPVKIEYTWYY